MKAFLGLALALSAITLSAILFAPVSAHAEVKTGVSVRTVKFDGRNLDVGYGVGGGCQEHRGDIELSIDEVTRVVSMNVVDITESGDNCEAFISGNAKIDVLKKVQELLYTRGLTEQDAVKLVFPTIDFTPYCLIPGC